LFSAGCSLLTDWYEENARNLPWRGKRNPYAIWISEIMLQQTQVKTVAPRFAAWFKHFPDIASIASATPDDVLKAWEGLGYYRRARLIHTAAQRIVSQYGGEFPQTFDDIAALPGIGRSTAGAIASFCFGANTPVLDGNVKRVLRRWHAIPEATEKKLWLWAQQAIDQNEDPALWNQAMMELGATVCSSNTPDCGNCPVSAYCASAFQVKSVDKKRKTVPVLDVHWLVSLYLCPRRGIWLTQRSDSGIWGGLWTPPITELDEPPARNLTHVHLLTHRRLHLYSETLRTEPSGDGQWVWDMTKFALPTGIRRLLEKYQL